MSRIIDKPSLPATRVASAPVGTQSRRSFLSGAAVGAAGVAAAVGVRRYVRASSPGPAEPHPALSREAFEANARRILAERERQTIETVSALKAKYEHPILGRFDVWDLVERMGRCVDITDGSLGGVSQWMHVVQALAAMKEHGTEDPDMLLIAILHDLGKVFLLSGEVPENVLGTTARLGQVEPGSGLDGVVYQFGHAELIYSRIKDHVPDHVAWTVRYHNINLQDADPFMNDRDRDHAGTYLSAFRVFDTGFKSMYWAPQVDIDECRELVRRYFPQPVLF